MAERRRAEWIAVFVETAAFHALPDAERGRVTQALRLAEQLGGEAVTIPGEDVADEIVRYAARRNATELILGKSGRSRLRELWAGSPVNEVIRRSGNIDVRVISAERKPRAAGPRGRPWRFRPSAWALASLIVATAGLAAKGLQLLLPLPDPAMVFLAGVLLAAVFCGRGPSIVAAVASMLVYDFFFVEPLYRFTVTKPQDVLSLFAFLIVAVFTSSLMARIRAQAEAARRREARTDALFAFSRLIAGAAGIDDLLPMVARHVAEQFRGEVAIFLPAGGRLAVRAVHPATIEVGEPQRAAAAWVMEHGQVAGRGTDTLPGDDWFHVPLLTARGAVGVIALRPAAGETVVPLDQRQLLEAFARQAAVAIERTRVDVVLAEKAKTEAVIEAIEDGLVVLDQAGVVVHMNEVACAILELEREHAVGRRFEELGTQQPHYLRLRAAVRELAAHPEREGDRMEIQLFLRGRDHHYVLRPTPLRALDGSPAGLILALQDVTYIRDQEAHREHLVATLSHELGTPLTSLRMAVELLERSDGLAPEQRTLVDTVDEDLTRLQDVAQRLLDLSRSRATGIALERKGVALGDVVARVVRLFSLQAREKGVALVAHVADETPSIPADETKLTWALSNLVANALRYTPGGGRIEIGVTPGAESVRLAVSDTGPGIPPERRERIFDRYVQDGGEAGAAGLGLAIVRDIVQAHGGRIHLQSEVGQGSTFALELPR
jgi:PAS domain S-box-containing protein